MTWYITLPGYKEKIIDQCENITGIVEYNPGKPLQSQLRAIPESVTNAHDYFVAAPKEAFNNEDDEAGFAVMIEEGMQAIQMERRTFDQHGPLWCYNSLKNYWASMEATPVDTRKNAGIGLKAVVSGSGPSMRNYQPDPKALVYSSWSGQKPFVVHYMAHIDARKPKQVDLQIPKYGIIFTPVAYHEFLEIHPYRCVYFPRDHAACWFFAEKRGIPDHGVICGNVCDMLIQVAIMAGHTEIELIGMDGSYKTVEALREYRENPYLKPVEALNYKGETVYTEPSMLTYKRSIEEHVSRNPHIKFTAGSSDMIVYEGVSCPSIN
jgi:hypothetical protein